MILWLCEYTRNCGTPELKARRFGVNRESRQGEADPALSELRGGALAWLEGCLQKESVQRSCQTAV